jgi:hypothetical protein
MFKSNLSNRRLKLMAKSLVVVMAALLLAMPTIGRPEATASRNKRVELLKEMAKSVQQAKTATPAQIDAILAKHPKLSSGFTTPGGVRARVVKTVPGGVVVNYTSANGRHEGKWTVLGPPTVMKALPWYAQFVLDHIAGNGEIGGTCTKSTTTTTTTVEGGKTTSTTTTTTETRPCSA